MHINFIYSRSLFGEKNESDILKIHLIAFGKKSVQPFVFLFMLYLK